MTQNHASEAADKIYAGYLRRANSCEPGATAIVQAAIDAATAEKDAEIAALRAKLANAIPMPTTAGGPTV